MALKRIGNGEAAESGDTSPLDFPYTVSIDGLGAPIYLFPHKNVWRAHSAEYLINTLAKSGKINFSEIIDSVDVGAGSGVLGISLLHLGVKHVYFTDINLDALDLIPVTARQNGLKPGQQFDVMDSDALQELVRRGIKVDMVISNVPMNPQLDGVHVDNPAFRSNQNPGGRQVLDDIIRDAGQVLNLGGYIVLTCSSRQGQITTEIALREFPGQCTIINRDPIDGFPGVNEALTAYHSPYFMHWRAQTMDDQILRVYNLDEHGLPFTQDEIPASDPKNKKTRTIFSKVENGKLVHYRAISNGDPAKTLVYPFLPYDLEAEPIKGFPLNEIPKRHPSDRSWYHRYNIIVGQKTYEIEN